MSTINTQNQLPETQVVNTAVSKLGQKKYDQLVSSFDKADSYDAQITVCEGFIASGTLPKGYDNPYAVLTAIEMGKAFGIPPVAAIFSIDIIQGSPRPSARLLASSIYRLGGWYNLIRYAEKEFKTVTDPKTGETKEVIDDVVTEIEFCRPIYDIRTGERLDISKQKMTFTMKEAAALGYTGKGDKSPWKTQPANMMFWRCISKGARYFFPDSEQSKFYTADEWLDSKGVIEYKMTDQGEVIYDN